MRPIATTKLPPCPSQDVLNLRAWCMDRIDAVIGINPATPIAKAVHDRAIAHLRGACQLETLRELHAALGLARTIEEVSHCLALHSAKADAVTPALAGGL